MGKPRQRRAAPTHRARATTPRPSLAVRIRAQIVAILPVVAIFLGTRQLLAEAYRIPSGSMEPALLVGDWLFVNKLRYGPHIPFTELSLPGYASPRRGDIAVFVSPPQDPTIRITPQQVTPTLVKRIVGIGGDTLLMRHGHLLVNGAAVAAPNSFLLPDSIADQPQPIFEWQHRIELGGSRFGPPIAAPSLHEWGPIIVPDGTYFMMGDNRDNSVDSRYYGPVPRANLRGTPTFVYYSYDPESGLDYFRAVTAIRWGRLGTWIR
ncbi:MAG TPA: signal peptidase I [Gemmatimonadaceae bacterium]|nr:signal peptidase I [Gemmatimonadaceae bacterium]